MKPKLVPKPGRTLLRAWSMWLTYLSGIAGLAPIIVPYLDDIIPRWVSIALLCLVPIARILDQGGVDAD